MASLNKLVKVLSIVLVGTGVVLLGVNIALGNSIAEACPPMDIDGSGTVTVNELVLAVSSVLNGCS